jgi:hypothetical protein
MTSTVRRIELSTACLPYRPLLHRLLDGETDAEELILVHGHVVGCDACGLHLDWLRLQQHLLRATVAPGREDLRLLWEHRLKGKLGEEKLAEALDWLFYWLLLELVEGGSYPSSWLPPCREPDPVGGFRLRREQVLSRRRLGMALRGIGRSPRRLFRSIGCDGRTAVPPAWTELQPAVEWIARIRLLAAAEAR